MRARAHEIPLGDLSIPIAHREDLLKMKRAAGRVVALEVKAGQTPKRQWFRWLERMRDTLGDSFMI